MKSTLLLLALLVTYVAQAQTVGFENPPYNGSAGGTVASGQGGWYLPGVAGSVDGNIYTYAGNALGATPNPNGQAQFLGGMSQGGTAFARTQRDFTFSPADDYAISFEMNGFFSGTLPSAQNLGSFSTQDSVTTRIFIALMRWNDVNTATSYNAGFNAYDSLGTAMATQVPGPMWQDCAVNHWYRQSVAIDYVTNSVLAVGITDMGTRISRCTRVTGWYLQGGAAPTLGMPTAARFFAGGAAGNVMCWDNLAIADSSNRVTGTVTFGDLDALAPRPDCAVFEFRDPNTLHVVSSVVGLLSPVGAYDINAPGPGTYNVAVKHTHWLRQGQVVTITGGVGTANFTLINGDADEDNELSIGDYALLSAAFNSVPNDPNWNPMTDFNGDEEVNIGDFAILSFNFGMIGDD
ncbi:MAG TPA: hypothetical protein PLL78_06970 [Fimbriimonadaceae bacterium]|nr:hypothetical protein [Fimbriimonadaceae bacterium]HRJ96412.1 hypothetical protein [Fimbriimonadaceae bacterium]